MKINKGGLATDMTLRDYFAGQALAGLMAQCRPLSTMLDWEESAKTPEKWHSAFVSYLVPRCVDLADELILELGR